MFVGLGNPGLDYAATRHNVGAAAAELLARRHQLSLRIERRAKARTASGRIAGARATVAVPMTYMNDSGESVTVLARQVLGGLDPAALSRLVVIHDELDLAPGVVRIKLAGGTAGHNGLKSIGAHLHSLEFVRVRIGVGKPPGSMSGADYVLRRVGKDDAEVLAVGIERAADAAESIATDGVERAMNVFNTK